MEECILIKNSHMKLQQANRPHAFNQVFIYNNSLHLEEQNKFDATAILNISEDILENEVSAPMHCCYEIITH